MIEASQFNFIGRCRKLGSCGRMRAKKVETKSTHFSSRLEGSEAEAYFAVSQVTVDNFVFWLKGSNLLLSVLTRSLKELVGLGVRDCGLGERIYYGDCFDGKD